MGLYSDGLNTRHRGDCLVDDRRNDGASGFDGTWLRLGDKGGSHPSPSGRVADWPAAVARLSAALCGWTRHSSSPFGTGPHRDWKNITTSSAV